MSSTGVMWSLRSRSRSGERRSVKSSDLPRGMVSRAFLIQKISISGRGVKPMRIQPIEILKKSSALPPMRKMRARIMLRMITAG